MSTINISSKSREEINLATYLAEPVDNEQAYIEKLVKAFEKVIKDEVTATLLYVKLAQLIPVRVVQEQLVEHTFEEFKHYSMLVDYAYNHGFLKNIEINVDLELINSKNIYETDDYKNMVKLIQDLEQKAINDYEMIIGYTSAYEDHDTYELIESILEDERNHFDDLSFVLNQKRKVITKFSRPEIKCNTKFSRNNQDISFSTDIDNDINDGEMIIDEDDDV